MSDRAKPCTNQRQAGLSAPPVVPGVKIVQGNSAHLVREDRHFSLGTAVGRNPDKKNPALAIFYFYFFFVERPRERQ